MTWMLVLQISVLMGVATFCICIIGEDLIQEWKKK